MVWKLRNYSLDSVVQGERGLRIAIRNEFENRGEICLCFSAPQDREHERRFASMISRSLAITSSCGADGRWSSSDAWTFSRSQRSYASASSAVANSDSIGDRMVLMVSRLYGSLAEHDSRRGGK